MVDFVLFDMLDTMVDLRQRETECEYTVMDSNDCINYDVNIWHCEEYRCISIYGIGSDKGAIRKERKV